MTPPSAKAMERARAWRKLFALGEEHSISGKVKFVTMDEAEMRVATELDAFAAEALEAAAQRIERWHLGRPYDEPFTSAEAAALVRQGGSK